MKRNISMIFVFVMAVILFAKTVSAQDVKLPKFEFGQDKTIIEPIEGDLVAAGKNITLDTDIDGDVYVAGGNVKIDGTITGDLVVAGGEVVINGFVGKNLIAAGGKVSTGEMAGVGGYTLAAGGELTLSGQFDGPVKVMGGKLTTTESTFVAGDLTADVGESIGGDRATVEGKREINIHEDQRPNRVEDKIRYGTNMGGSLFSLLVKLATMMILLWISKNLIFRFGDELPKVAANLGWGLVILAAGPLLIILLMISVLGFPIGLMLIPLFMMALYLSWFVTAGAFGSWIHKNGWVKNKNKYLLGAIGAMALYILGWTPFIGGLLKFLAVLTGLGMSFRLARLYWSK